MNFTRFSLFLFTLLSVCCVCIDARGHANLHQLYQRIQAEERLTTASSSTHQITAAAVQASTTSSSLTATTTPSIITEWFDQKLDHFDAQELTLWQQRFHYSLDFYQKGGPAFSKS